MKKEMMPGGAIPESELWGPRINLKTGVQIGVKDPQGQFYRFQEGEEFVLIKKTRFANREPYIRLKDGKEISFDAWKAERVKKFKKIFETIDNDYARVYAKVITDFPEMKNLEILTGDAEQYQAFCFTGGFWQRPTKEEPYSQIVIKKSEDLDAGTIPDSRKVSAQIMADLLGIPFETLKKNMRILKLFIFLHEIGHAHDFENNYFRHDAFGFDLVKSANANAEQRYKEMATLPLPGENPGLGIRFTTAELQQKLDRYAPYFNSLGISSVAELISAQDRAYRNLPSEHYADMFAANFLKKYWKKFFKIPRGTEK